MGAGTDFNWASPPMPMQFGLDLRKYYDLKIEASPRADQAALIQRPCNAFFWGPLFRNFLKGLF